MIFGELHKHHFLMSFLPSCCLLTQVSHLYQIVPDSDSGVVLLIHSLYQSVKIQEIFLLNHANYLK